jgi:hypothetical protein
LWDSTNKWLSVSGTAPKLKLVDTTASALDLDIILDANQTFFVSSSSATVNRLPTLNLTTESTGIGSAGGLGAALTVDGTYLSSSGANPVRGILMQRNDNSAVALDFVGGQSNVWNNNTNSSGEALGHLAVVYGGPSSAASNSAVGAELFLHASATGSANGINIAVHTARTSTGTDYTGDVKGLQIITYKDFSSNYANYPGMTAWGTPADVSPGHAIFISGQEPYLNFITALAGSGTGGGIFSGALAFQVNGSGSITTVGGLATVSATKTIRNSAGTGTCTLIFTGGVLTGGTC